MTCFGFSILTAMEVSLPISIELATVTHNWLSIASYAEFVLARTAQQDPSRIDGFSASHLGHGGGGQDPNASQWRNYLNIFIRGSIAIAMLRPLPKF